jgi:hypothetical protein
MNEVRMQARVIGPGAHGHLTVAVQGPGDTTKDLDVPIERIPLEFRMPNCEFVAVVHFGEFRRFEPAAKFG